MAHDGIHYANADSLFAEEKIDTALDTDRKVRIMSDRFEIRTARKQKCKKPYLVGFATSIRLVGGTETEWCWVRESRIVLSDMASVVLLHF
jgi:hypothetical protein